MLDTAPRGYPHAPPLTSPFATRLPQCRHATLLPVQVYCPSPTGDCWSADIWNHTTGECWLKWQKDWDNNGEAAEGIQVQVPPLACPHPSHMPLCVACS